MIISLPMPPSANMMFATDFRTKRRFMSKEYASWKKRAAETLGRYAALPQLEKPYGVHIRLNLNHQGDIANREKACCDALVTAGIIVGDNFINWLLIERDRDVEACLVEVWTLGEARDEA